MASLGDAMLMRWNWPSTRGRSMTCRSMTCRNLRPVTVRQRAGAAVVSRLKAVVAGNPDANKSQEAATESLQEVPARHQPQAIPIVLYKDIGFDRSPPSRRRRDLAGRFCRPSLLPMVVGERSLSSGRMPKRGTTGTFNHQQVLLTAASAHWQAA
jgi:hypothetical protein